MPGKPHRVEPKLRLVPRARADGRTEGAPALRPPAPAFDDSELLAAVRRGDANVASAIHDRMRPQVDRTVRRLLGPGDVDHDDIAQLALLELITTIHRYRGDCSLDSWTGTVTAHVVYKHLRRRKTERRLFSVLDAELLADTRSPRRLDRDPMVRSVLRRVVSVLEGVDPVKAWAFVLHDVFGYDLKEIAQITEITESAAQTRLVRGRRDVHERIAADPELVDLIESLEGRA